MNANEFVAKWARSQLKESAGYQEHFIDLCRLVGHETPGESDPTGELFAFEKGARHEGGDGFADVWLNERFAWEYKGKGRDLGAAYLQVLRYREALNSPPLLVVCDFNEFHIHTNWTNTEKWMYRFSNEDIGTPKIVDVMTVSGPAKDPPQLTAMEVLRALFFEPDELKPGITREDITKEAASLFGRIALELREGWKVDETRIARFVTRVLFCMFATDVELLPAGTFSDVIEVNKNDPKAFREHLSTLFRVMNTGGTFAMRTVPEFDGRLFEDDDVPEEINGSHIRLLSQLNALNWSAVEPVVFGTLFERVLDPGMRRKLGAHYTSRSDIELIVEPVLMEPLRAEWNQLKVVAGNLMADDATRPTPRKNLTAKLKTMLEDFQHKVATMRVLDPACGSGNFLYVSFALLKALEKEIIAFGSIYRVEITPRVHPTQLLGIETSHYAHELASIVIWIGYLQWKQQEGIPMDEEIPIMQPLDQIVYKDALIDLSNPKRPREAAWPEADVIVGNPPFLGGKLLRTNLGDEYVDKLFAVYEGRVARESDLCCYWFEKARGAIEHGKARRAGLLATQGIRGGANRRVLERIKQTGDIFYAQADRKWIQDGVAVRVSMVGFDDGSEMRRLINESPDDDPEKALARARPVEGINANLTSRSDVTQARRLKENLGISFMGDTKVGPFEIERATANAMLSAPNPHRKSNSEVVRPWVNGLDVTRRPRDMWIIDFPPGMSEAEAAKFEAPFAHVKWHVRPFRKTAKSGDATGVPWWIHQRPRTDMREALAGRKRFIVTPAISKHRLFVWIEPPTLPDHALLVFAKSDNYTFGVLHSVAHEAWALLVGTQLESRPRYTPTTCFETFPFPEPTKLQKNAIATAAAELNELRENWLNPPDAINTIGATALQKRTLTNLYNERPDWLANAHRALDQAVFEAYGWPESPDDLTKDEIIGRLLALNLSREPA